MVEANYFQKDFSATLNPQAKIKKAVNVRIETIIRIITFICLSEGIFVQISDKTKTSADLRDW